MKRKLSILLAVVLAAALLLSACGSTPAGVKAEDAIAMVEAFLDTEGDLAYCGPKVSQEDATRVVQAVQEAADNGYGVFMTYGEPIGIYTMKKDEVNTHIASLITKEGKDKGAFYIEEIVFPD